MIRTSKNTKSSEQYLQKIHFQRVILYSTWSINKSIKFQSLQRTKKTRYTDDSHRPHIFNTRKINHVIQKKKKNSSQTLNPSNANVYHRDYKLFKHSILHTTLNRIIASFSFRVHCTFQIYFKRFFNLFLNLKITF